MRSLHATAVVCGCLALLGGAASVSQPPTFKEFTRRYGKQYGVQDFIQREKVYEKNLKVIASLNREGKGQFWAEVNQVRHQPTTSHSLSTRLVHGTAAWPFSLQTGHPRKSRLVASPAGATRSSRVSQCFRLPKATLRCGFCCCNQQRL